MGALGTFLELATEGIRSTVPAQSMLQGPSSFHGAENSRLVSGWRRSGQIPDRQLRKDLQALRERSRDLVHNTSFGARMVHLNRINVIGPDGLKLQMKIAQKVRGKGGKVAVQPDEDANLKVQTAWALWGRKEYCTVTGKYTWKDVQNLAVTHLKTDGEFIARKIYGQKGNPFGFSLQIIDPALLDEWWERSPAPGVNQIRLGVELDQYDKPVAYWFKKRTLYADTYERERVPAEEIIHLYNPLRASFTRGIPILASVMMSAKMLDAYEEAEVTAARMGAAKAGFMKTPTGDEYTGAKNDQGGRTMEVEPGVIEELPAGWDFQPFMPEHPTTAFGPFTTALLHKLAAGLNLSHHSLTSDLSGVNYSSIRAGVLEDRESHKEDQTLIISHLATPVFEAWMQTAMLTGALDLPASKFSTFNVPTWHGRRWGWVDPMKDVQATILSIKAGLSTHAKEAAEQGDDINDMWTELAAEKLKAKALDLDLTTFAPETVVQDASADKKAGQGGEEPEDASNAHKD
jgi:lambda family phage portal protein